MMYLFLVLCREKVTRHLYYLQLKENVLNYNHVCQEEKCFQIVSYALQADYGNYNPHSHGEGYFDPREYFPAWVRISLIRQKIIGKVCRHKIYYVSWTKCFSWEGANVCHI